MSHDMKCVLFSELSWLEMLLQEFYLFAWPTSGNIHESITFTMAAALDSDFVVFNVVIYDAFRGDESPREFCCFLRCYRC